MGKSARSLAFLGIVILLVGGGAYLLHRGSQLLDRAPAGNSLSPLERDANRDGGAPQIRSSRKNDDEGGAAATPAVTGVLLMGGKSLAGRAYWTPSSERGDEKRTTSKSGGWELVSNLEGEVRLSFALYEGVVATFALSVEDQFADGPLELSVPRFFAVDVEFESRNDIRWSLSAGVATGNRLVSDDEHVVSTLERTFFVNGRGVHIAAAPISTPPLAMGVDYTYFCPEGYDAIVQVATQDGFVVSPTIARASPPTRVWFVARPVRGVFGQYDPTQEEIPALSAVFWRWTGSPGWSRVLMHNGEAFIGLPQSTEGVWPVEVEFRAPNGELFSVEIDQEFAESESRRIIFTSGTGTAPLLVEGRPGASIARVLVANSLGITELSKAHYDAVHSAYQYHLEEEDVIASIPANSPSDTWILLLYSDGSFAGRMVGGPTAALEAEQSAASTLVVPRHIVAGMDSNETVVVGLQLRLPDLAPLKEWVIIERRRYKPGDTASDWTVRPVRDGEYRVRVQRIRRVDEAWKLVEETLWSLEGVQLF